MRKCKTPLCLLDSHIVVVATYAPVRCTHMQGLLDMPEFGRNIEEYMATQGDRYVRHLVHVCDIACLHTGAS